MSHKFKDSLPALAPVSNIPGLSWNTRVPAKENLVGKRASERTKATTRWNNMPVTGRRSGRVLIPY